MPGSLRIAIVGGGIGGLTAALALRARGLDASVFEQAEAVREIGAGVSIHPNAARLLKCIGLDDQLRRIGSPINGITLRSSKGEAITTPAGPATPAFSQQTGQGYNVHRATSSVRGIARQHGQARPSLPRVEGGQRRRSALLRERCCCGSRCRHRCGWNPFRHPAPDRSGKSSVKRRHHGVSWTDSRRTARPSRRTQGPRLWIGSGRSLSSIVTQSIATQ
jgi:FAD binding domain